VESSARQVCVGSCITFIITLSLLLQNVNKTDGKAVVKAVYVLLENNTPFTR